jgi:acyl-CoA synthetase (AMP-forming)/AMP-acid ligase II
MDLEHDRAVLRKRWYDEGFFGELTMADYIRRSAVEFPDSEMIFVGSARPSRATLPELDARSERVAAGLYDLGLRRGDVIAVQVPNWVEGTLAYQAAMKLGLVIVPIVHIYGPSEVGFIVRESGAKALVIPDRWRNINYLERLEGLTNTPSLEYTVVIGDTVPPGATAWQQLEDTEPRDLGSPGSPDDVCLLIYTSGTTADPKGVQHTHNTLIAEITSLRDMLGVGSEVVTLAAFPAGHIGGVLNYLRCFMFGVTAILMDAWDPDLGARMVAEHKARASAGAPFFLSSMLASGEALGLDLTSMRGFMVGAASVPPALVEEADRRGVIAYRAYGSSEHPVITTGFPDDPLDKRAGTDGRLTPGNEIRIVDDEDNDLPAGSEGEILSRGPEMFIGYRNPALDAETFLAGGWFRTGDVGIMDTEGFLTITDRKKDVIIRGGENISSKEVEDILARHDAVFEAAVVAAPDERYGEKVCAFIICQPDRTIDLAEVQRHFRDAGVARQKTPEKVILVDVLPRSMSGKVRKVELRDQLRG